MFEALSTYFTAGGGPLPGSGLRWAGEPLRLNLVSNLLIGIAFCSIAVGLGRVAGRQGELSFKWIVGLFVAVAAVSGAAHLVEAWNVWQPVYWLDAAARALAAMISAVLAVALWSTMPRILALQAREQWSKAGGPFDREALEHERAGAGRATGIVGQAARVFGGSQPEGFGTGQQGSALAGHLFDLMPDAVIMADAAGKIVLINAQAEKIFGYAGAEMIGQPVEMLMPAQHRDAHAVLRARYMGHPHPRPMRSGAVLRAQTKHGREFAVDIMLAPLVLDGQTMVLSVVRDMTEHERDERALREREEHFRYLFEANPMPMWVRDEETDRFLAVNEAAVRLYGYTHEEFLEMTGLDLRAPEDRAAYLEFSRQGDARLKTLRHWRHRKKDGTLIEVEVTLHGFAYKGRPARLALIADITERVRAERALQESEQRYRDLFDLNPSPMWVYDNDTLGFVAVNAAAIRQYGYTKDEFAHMTLTDLLPPEDVAPFLGQIRRRDPRSVVARSIRQRRKDGTVIDAEILSSPLPHPQRVLRIVHAIDVTHRNRAEAALRASEERLRTIADNVPVLIGYIDAEERYQFVNKTYEDWYGIPMSHYHGRSLREIFGEEGYRAVKPEVDAALGGEVVSRERRTRSRIREQYAQFTFLPHRGADGTVRGFYSLAYDVTERRKATEALAAERNLLRSVIDALPDQIYVKDRELRYILVNAASLADRGLSSHDEVVGKRARDFFPPERAAAFEAEDENVMRSGTPMLNREQSRELPGGDVRWHLTNKVPLRAADAVIGVIGINRDVTEMRRAAESIRQLNAELEERVQERTAALEVANKELESFAYSVSHDLRAPLRSIDGFSRALLEDYRDRFDETGRDYLRRVRNATQRMGNLIDDLLTLSRITRSEIRLETVNLSALARELAAQLEKDDPERKVDFDIQAGIRVKADPNLLRVALQNLLHNAWKFTGRTGNARIDVGAARQQGRQVCYVRDNGAGFDMGYADRLFGAFQRLHSESEFPGTGVGLATVQRIVRRHGGEVWAEGAVGRGATFYFTFGHGKAGTG